MNDWAGKVIPTDSDTLSSAMAQLSDWLDLTKTVIPSLLAELDILNPKLLQPEIAAMESRLQQLEKEVMLLTQQNGNLIGEKMKQEKIGDAALWAKIAILNSSLWEGNNSLFPRLPLPPNTTSTSRAPRLFSSLTFIFERSAARTATQNHNSLLDCKAFFSTSQSYAKKRSMPPKKVVKEEKILLGRPGNSLKSGIVRITLLTSVDASLQI